MSVQTLKKSTPAIPVTAHWSETLAAIGPQIAEEGRRCDAANEYVAANMKLLREHGFLALAVPAEFGGGDLTRTELADMLRALARLDSATALAFAMHTHTVAAAAWRWRHQKAPMEGLLKKVAAENIQLLSSGGSDWLDGSGKAVKVEGGYRIHGRKVFASGAPSANLFNTSAIADETDGPTVLHFGLPMTAQGVSIVPSWDTLGMRGTASHDVVLDGVFVPDAAVAGKRKPGVWHPLFHIISMVAFPLVYAVYAGVAEQARDIAVKAAAARKDASVVDLVGALDTELTAMRITLDSMVSYSEVAQPGPDTTNVIFQHRALVARGAIKTVELAMEAAGGAAYFRRLGLERLFRDVQAARFHPLQDGAQRRLTGRVALGLPIDG